MPPLQPPVLMRNYASVLESAIFLRREEPFSYRGKPVPVP